MWLADWYSQPCPALASDDLVLGNWRSHLFPITKIILHHFEILLLPFSSHKRVLSDLMLACKMVVRAFHASSKPEEFTGKGLNLLPTCLQSQINSKSFLSCWTTRGNHCTFLLPVAAFYLFRQELSSTLWLYNASVVGWHLTDPSASMGCLWWASMCRTASRTPLQLPCCLQYLWVKSRQMHWVRRTSDANCIWQPLWHCRALPQDF